MSISSSHNKASKTGRGGWSSSAPPSYDEGLSTVTLLASVPALHVESLALGRLAHTAQLRVSCPSGRCNESCVIWTLFLEKKVKDC